MTPRQIYFINLARKKKGASSRNAVRPGTSKATQYVTDKIAEIM